MNLLSVDPGAVHTAWAVWELHADPATDGTRWKCREAHETGPNEFLDLAYFWLNYHTYSRVACEAFFLQGDKALAQTGSSFGTVEVIGVLRHLCRWNAIPFELVTPSTRAAAFKRMKAVHFNFPRDPAGHMKSAISVGAVATEWRATNHFEGDGVS